MSRLSVHTSPDRNAIAANAAKEPEGERIRAELEDFLRRNKIVAITLDTDEHCVDVDIVKLPPRMKSVLTKWGAIRVKDEPAISQPRAPGKNWTAEDYRRSADSQQVAEDIIRRVVSSTLKLAYIRQVSVLDDSPEEAIFVADGLSIALGEDTGCNDPEDLTAENCELLFVEKELRELLHRALANQHSDNSGAARCLDGKS